ncbi:MAG: hypothetical protein ABIR81_10185 [Ginsengibacter sp.]
MRLHNPPYFLKAHPTLIIFIITVLASCSQADNKSNPKSNIENLAKQYVTLGLAIGKYDPPFIDAYYGPDSLKPVQGKATVFPKDSLLKAVDTLSQQLKIISLNNTDSANQRATWLLAQLKAYERRLKIFSGEPASFDEETKDLFGVQVPVYSEDHFKKVIASLDSLLPGKGPVADRFQALANKFIIPKNKLDTVFKASIAECRKRTLKHFDLPAKESFALEFVTNKSWSGYNYYKGNYKSLIQINTDLDIFIDRAIDVGSHESYPGHHVYNMLLEKNLYVDKGWVEISIYPLFSPQSLIAEGSANYGIEVAFPGNEKIEFCKNVLLPLAGLDTSNITLFFNALAIRSGLNYARNEVARGIINGSMTTEEAMRWLIDYCLYNKATALKSIDFIKDNRTYVINYNYGMDLVKGFVEARGGNAENPGKRWEIFKHLLSNEITTADLIGNP